MVNKLYSQTIFSEFISHQMPQTGGLVSSLYKTLLITSLYISVEIQYFYLIYNSDDSNLMRKDNLFLPERSFKLIHSSFFGRTAFV